MDAIKDTYLTIDKPSEGVYKEKGSKFTAFAYPIQTEDEVKELLREIKNKYFDARHHCFAWRVGINGDAWRAVDDGEPSGTGGRPILGQLQSANVTNVVIFVVRYFGGIKLGVSGLINAYRNAAADALANACIIEKESKDSLTLYFGYAAVNDVMKIIKDEQPDIDEQIFDTQCKLKISVRKSKTEQIKNRLLKVDKLRFEEI